MKLTGMESLKSKLLSMPPRVRSNVSRTQKRIGEDLEGKSKDRAPYRPGPNGEHLRDHAYHDVADAGDSTTLVVGYLGPQDYLLVQHEGGWRDLVAWGQHYGPTRIEHYTTPGSGPKFLENPWTENKPRYKNQIKDAAKGGLRDD